MDGYLQDCKLKQPCKNHLILGKSGTAPSATQSEPKGGEVMISSWLRGKDHVSLHPQRVLVLPQLCQPRRPHSFSQSTAGRLVCLSARSPNPALNGAEGDLCQHGRFSLTGSRATTNTQQKQLPPFPLRAFAIHWRAELRCAVNPQVAADTR